MKTTYQAILVVLLSGCNLIGGPTETGLRTTTEEDVSADVQRTEMGGDKDTDLRDVVDAAMDMSRDLQDSGPTDVGMRDLGSDAADLSDTSEDMGADVLCRESAGLLPVLYWSFDDPSIDGRSFSNLSGSPMTAVGSSSVALIEGVSGKGLRFNGSDSVLTTAHGPVMEQSKGALSLWFKKTGDSSCSDTTTGCGLFSKDAHGNGEGGHFTVAFTGENKIRVRLQSIDTTYQVESEVLDSSKFTHVVASFGPGGIRLYIDGTLMGSNAYSGGLHDLSSLPKIRNTESIAVGCSKWQVVPGTEEPKRAFFQGVIDEVLFFDRELSDSDINKLADGCSD